MHNSEIWKVQDCEGAEYLERILEFLLVEYSRIFGEETMNAEMCSVYNDPQAECPMLVINYSPIRIRLSQISLSYWCQTIYQLSHELCHYAIRQHKEEKIFTLSWFEEIVCEAMSLYALKWSAENWGHCKLNERNQTFSTDIMNYLNQELGETGTDAFKTCTSIQMLAQYEENLSTCRETHRNERNQLYHAIIQNPIECACFCDYSRYVQENRVTIDFEKWESNDSRRMVRFLHHMQPCEGNIQADVMEMRKRESDKKNARMRTLTPKPVIGR